jgi:alpha-galactosidase
MMMHNDRSGDARPLDDENVESELTRRSFLFKGAATLGGMTAMTAAPGSMGAAESRPLPIQQGVEGDGKPSTRRSTFLDIVRVPDEVTAFTRFDRTLPAGMDSLTRQNERWAGKQVVVESKLERDVLVLTLEAPSTPVAAVHVRWGEKIDTEIKLLGDAWERSYGELGWRSVIPERVMPWYFATFDQSLCHGYGVRTDARALCFWQLDAQGVSLWLNVTNGGNGVELGDRKLTMATVVAHRGGEDAVDSVAVLCRALCAQKSRTRTPIYGANDWNYSYGDSTAETILRDTEFIAGLSPTGGVRPFSVIDGGWSNGTPGWPDMQKLAHGIKQTTVRPGIWIRPLEAPRDAATALLLPDGRFGERKDRARELAYDPTVPEAREKIAAKLRQAAGWGYEMVKHDFSTYDLLGQWGFEMGPQPTVPGWSLHDRSQTNAEVVAGLYALIRETAANDVVIDGCNTFGHLGQGVFDMQRIGDDTSGRQWERTRRMGVNTLSFRLPQNGTFFTVDPDMVGVTDAIPWELNRQWLDVLARSGAATIVAVAPSRRGPEQRAALKEAFQIAAAGGTGAKPVDWMETSVAEKWTVPGAKGRDAERRYQWSGSGGASPFLGP